jgi:hypothetical protein
VLHQLISGTDHLDNFGDEHNDNKKRSSRYNGNNGVSKKKHHHKKGMKKNVLNKTSSSSSSSSSTGKNVGTVNMFAIRGSALYQIPVPEKLETKTYGACAEYLASRVSERGS